MRRSAGEGHRSREGKHFRWELRIDGRRIVRKSATKAGLDRKIEIVREELRKQGLLIENVNNLRFGEVYRWYLETEIRPQCSPRTYESYESTFRNHLSNLASLKLGSVSPSAIRTISKGLSEKGHARTAEYVILILSRFYNWCIRRELVTFNPTCHVSKPKANLPKTRIMSKEDIATIFGEAKRRFERLNWRCYPVLLFCLNTGLRISEALALQDDDISHCNGNRCVHVHRQVLYQSSKWILRSTKCNSDRTIALNDLAKHAVDLAKLAKIEDSGRAQDALVDHGFLFPNEIGEPMRACVPYRAFTRLQRSIGIVEPYTVHELRHTYLSFLARENPLQVVMKVAGHSSLRTTERYIKALEEDVMRATTSLAY